VKARIVTNDSVNTIPPRLIKDKAYAKEFWEYLCKTNPNKNYGNNFDEWYDKLLTLNFSHKVQRLDSLFVNSKNIHNEKKGGV